MQIKNVAQHLLIGCVVFWSSNIAQATYIIYLMFKCMKTVFTKFCCLLPCHTSWHNKIIYMPLKLKYNSKYAWDAFKTLLINQIQKGISAYNKN